MRRVYDNVRFSKETVLLLQSAAHIGVLYLMASLACGVCFAFWGS
ncbi:hypothetical protein PO124_31240 [Bacillus licheniformis]|nr:hypothetical protein [Bacillus licheniformis]